MAIRRPSLLERAPRSSIALVAGLVLSMGLVALREVGVLEPPELAVYDRQVAGTLDAAPSRSRVVLIDIREPDHRRYKFPVPDGTLAEALAILLRHEPRAVGIDLFRSEPVSPGEKELERLVLANPRVVMVEAAGESGLAMPPPIYLKGSSQVGFADFVTDADGKLRRGLLQLQGEGTSISLGLRLAMKYLVQEETCERPAYRPLEDGMALCRRKLLRFGADDGGYVGEDDRGVQVLLDFRGAFPHFERYSLSRLLANEVPAGALRDRVVLIGTTAESVKDDHITPAARARGVEVHALVVDQLLSRALDGATGIRVLSPNAETALVLGSGVLGACVVLATDSGLLLGAALLLPLLGFGFGTVAAFERGWWLPALPVALSWTGSLAGAVAMLSLRERSERRHLTDLFSRFISPEVAQQIWERREEFFDGKRPKADRLTISALFSDIEGFTAAVEQMSPLQAMDWANTYMSALADVIGEFKGLVDDYAGDGIKADFGVLAPPDAEPTQTQRDACAAVDCALAMGRKIEELRKKAKDEQRLEPRVRLRVGILTGTAVVGFLGSTDRLKFTTIGDTVNTAARLESFDKESFKAEPEERVIRVLVGESTRALLGDRYEIQDLGDVALKGRVANVRIYRVWGPAKGQGDSERRTT